MPVRALFFDFDGLICDTESAARRSWEELYAGFGLCFPSSVWAAMTGHPAGEQVALADLGRRLGRPLDRATRAARRRRKYELCRAEPLRPGVAELLGAATDRGLALTMVSSSPRSWVEPHLARLGVRNRFGAVVTGDRVTAPKPAPALYRYALWLAGLQPGAAVAFEDSPVGVAAARAAGIRCVAVPGPAVATADLSGADLVIADLATYDLDAILLPDDRATAR